jgi:hypothetical protein
MLKIWGYGDEVEFEDLETAESAIRACGSDFAEVSLRLGPCGRVYNERGEIVGSWNEVAS